MSRLTARAITERVQRALDAPPPSGRDGDDGFRAGDPDRAVDRIIVCQAPSAAVIKRIGPGEKALLIALEDPASHEELWRQDGQYDIVGVLGWNDAPVRPGRGSAIFLHVALPDYSPTAGCIALAAGDLRTVLAAGITELFVLGG